MKRRARDMARLAELEAADASFSRNREFAFYSAEENQRARSLRGFLRALGDQLRHGTSPSADVRIEPCGDGSGEDDQQGFALTINDPALGYRRVVHLEAAEVRYLHGILAKHKQSLFAGLRLE